MDSEHEHNQRVRKEEGSEIMKKFFTNWRILLLLTMLLFSLVAISPNPWNNGVAIRSVAKNSAAQVAKIPPPLTKTQPVSRERVIAINNEPVTDEASYYALIEPIMKQGVNTTFTLQTNKNLYSLKTQPLIKTTVLNETELVNVTKEVFNKTLNETKNVTTQELKNKTVKKVIGVEDIGLGIYDAPHSNIREGLDLSGGTRVVLEPIIKNGTIKPDDIDLVIDNIKERLNVYGLSDIIVRPAKDLSGKQFIVVEIAGVNKEDIRELLSKQGKFEARIGNDTVFYGGKKDITYVCRSAECSGIDPRAGCTPSGDGNTICRFRFSISLSPAAAARQAALTKNLDITFSKGGESYLSKPIDLFLDDVPVDSLQIGADLKGRALANIEISGSGVGKNHQEAVQDALKNMKKLQTVLITGSLPFKLKIVKTDAISPVLGQEFVKNALYVGLFAILAVVFIVFLRYRRFSVSIPMIITMLSEATIILGFAALVGWNLDLAAIAAIIISIGTGVDDQIVIADETIHNIGEEGVARSWRERIKRAFFIIMASYVTTVVAMIPLWFAGAGMLRGFAITTIVGVSIGVFVTRPAFATMVEYFHKENKEE